VAESRLKIAADGTICLPERLRSELGWATGSTLEVKVEAGELRLRRIEVDPFAEARKEPDADQLERHLERQRQAREEAARRFDERLRQPGATEVRPEDRPDFWR
jgi:bifunctional DNA-binding transcriptional regulator/antitoxin component of YhaV-PrlF toxin-antitoxin module